MQAKRNHQREVVRCASTQREGGRDQATDRPYEYVKLFQTDPNSGKRQTHEECVLEIQAIDPRSHQILDIIAVDVLNS